MPWPLRTRLPVVFLYDARRRLRPPLNTHGFCIVSGVCSSKSPTIRGSTIVSSRPHVQECIGILEQFRCTRYNTLPRLPIHGDMCEENLIFSRECLRGVIDFGHCCSDTAIRDITIASAAMNAGTRRMGIRLDLHAARYFLQAYHEINPLTREEIDLIPAIVIAELADLFRWRIVEIIAQQAATGRISELEHLFKTMRWYNRHQKDIAQALRM